MIKISYKDATVSDGQKAFDSEGNCFEVVNPRCWQLGRWWVWAFRTNGEIEVEGRRYKIRSLKKGSK